MKLSSSCSFFLLIKTSSRIMHKENNHNIQYNRKLKCMWNCFYSRINGLITSFTWLFDSIYFRYEVVIRGDRTAWELLSSGCLVDTVRHDRLHLHHASRKLNVLFVVRFVNFVISSKNDGFLALILTTILTICVDIDIKAQKCPTCRETMTTRELFLSSILRKLWSVWKHQM